MTQAFRIPGAGRIDHSKPVRFTFDGKRYAGLRGDTVASALLVAWFMVRLGGFPWWKAAGAGVATALVAFVVFEEWFLVALPKGPIETWLGY